MDNNSTNPWSAFLEKIAATAPSFETIIVGILVAVATAVVQWSTSGMVLTDKTAWMALAAGVASAIFNYVTSLARVVNPDQSAVLKAKRKF